MISHSVLKLLNYTKFILHKISSAYAVRCSYIFGSSEYHMKYKYYALHFFKKRAYVAKLAKTIYAIC